MKELLLRIEYCDNDCAYPDNEYCLMISPNSEFSCVRCRVQRIPDSSWLCGHCKKEFGRLDRLFEIAAGPDLDDILSSPKIGPSVRAIPALAHIKRLCVDCFSRVM